MNKLEKLGAKLVDAVTFKNAQFNWGKETFRIIVRDETVKSEDSFRAQFVEENLFINSAVRSIKVTDHIFNAETKQEYLIEKIEETPYKLNIGNSDKKREITGTLVHLKK